MHWTDVDGAREHLDPRLFAATNGKRPTRKIVYNLVDAGLKVARRGDATPRLDRLGRLRAGRIMFSVEWIDAFLEQTAGTCAEPSENATVGSVPARRRA